MAEHTNDRKPEIGWQLSMAFGQGVGGTMMATQSALAKAFESYGHQLENDPGWSDKALVALEFTRVLGRFAAANALKDGRAVVDVADVDWALRQIRVVHAEPLKACPITDRNPIRA